MSKRTYAILGTGALGGFYGTRLQRAGMEVHYLLHRDYEHVRERGLVVESVSGNFTLPRVHAYGRAADMPRCDVVCVCLKSTQNHRLAELLPAVVKDDGVVLVLQNGLGIEDEVARIVGPRRVMGGLCFLCCEKAGPGLIRHLDYGRIVLGEYHADLPKRGACLTERLLAISDDFHATGIPTAVETDLLRARWKKLVWNVPFNGLTVVRNATTAQIMADAGAAELAEQLMREVAAGAAGYGRKIADEFIAQMLADTRKMTPYRPSMKIDFDERRPMEVEAIFGQPWRAAKAAGVDLPRLGMLYRELKHLDAANRAGRPEGG